MLAALARATETSGANPDATTWTAGAGAWTEIGRWSDGAPDPSRRAVVRGDSDVRVTDGTFLAGDLEIGFNAGDRARVEVNGGALVLMQDSLRLGEYTGSAGEFVLRDGAMHCAMDV
ncbi:MAG TPA: hypothetical protein VHD62_03100, partial [Opitutaceae bacterium]|nr:hypothetical protein [Opitutaceae bacterium]